MQDNEQKVYITIDLKSFYASVECVERNLASNIRTKKINFNINILIF